VIRPSLHFLFKAVKTRFLLVDKASFFSVSPSVRMAHGNTFLFYITGNFLHLALTHEHKGLTLLILHYFIYIERTRRGFEHFRKEQLVGKEELTDSSHSLAHEEHFLLSMHLTMNAAEYEALIHGLFLSKELGVKHLIIRGDSQLVINQENGTNEAKDQIMSIYLGKVLTPSSLAKL